MNKILGRLGAAAVLLAVVAAGASECRAVEPLATVPSQVAAAVYVQEWGQILWGLVTGQTGTQPSLFGDPIFNEDGSITQDFIASDGTQATLTFYMDGSVDIDLLLPNGSYQTVHQSPPSFDGVSVTTTDWSVLSSDGLSVSYTSTLDDQGTPFEIGDDVTNLIGSALLPEGVTQTFQVLTANGQTNVLSTQSDGSTFSLTVPMSPPEYALPALFAEATGFYVAPDYSVDFTLSPTLRNPLRWAAFVCDVEGGVTGTFSLNLDFSGSGQLEETSSGEPVLAALASWSADGDIQAYDLSGQDLHMGPTGAALDFLDHRWETLTALLAPAPGASALTARSHRFRTAPRLRTATPHPLQAFGADSPATQGGAAPTPAPEAPVDRGHPSGRR